MQTRNRAGLSARLNDLAQERLGREMSDSFAYSNGSIRKIDLEIDRVRKLLALLE